MPEFAGAASNQSNPFPAFDGGGVGGGGCVSEGLIEGLLEFFKL